MNSVSWILCPVRNALPITKGAISSFLNQTGVGTVRVLVINNGSSDGTTDWLRTQAPMVHTVNIYPQKGVAHAWNTGLRYLFEVERAQRVLVCNNDARLWPGTYRALDEDGGDFVTAVGSHDPKSIATEYVGQPTLTNARRPHPDFSCFLMRKYVWNVVGPFDEGFRGAFGEDCDYHVRMHALGIEAYSIGVPFFHIGGGSQTLKSATPEEQESILRAAGENREYFRRKHGFEIPTPENGGKDYYRYFGTKGPEAEKSGEEMCGNE